MSNLFFNVLNFDFPKENLTFYFSLEDFEFANRLHRSCFPINIEEIFPNILSTNTDFIYTSFDFEVEGLESLEIDFTTENENLIKRFYKRKLKYYFQKVAKQIIHVGYIDEIQVWLKSNAGATELYNYYEKFSIRIQLKTVSNCGELLITYDGKSKFLKQNIIKALNICPPDKISKVLYDGKIFSYDKFTELVEPDKLIAFPVISKYLADILNIEAEEIIKGNRYTKYLKYINGFITKFIWFKEFTDIFPLHTNQLLKVPSTSISIIADHSNDLAFKDGKKGRYPNREFRTLKPYANSPYNKIHIFFIYHTDDVAVKNTLKSYFQNGLKFYRGLNDYTGLFTFINDSLELQFNNKSNPIPELEKHFANNNFDNTQCKYFAFYLTPFTKEETLHQKEKIYVKVKEFLLKRDIPCQSIEPQNVIDAGDEYIWSLTNMSVAILAKLKGIPWKLHVEPQDELIVGVGAFKQIQDNVRYVGAAFSFSNTGHFNSFDYFQQHQTDVLAGSIEHSIREFATINGLPKRIVIHFYKRLSVKELIPIEKALQDLELPKPIPIFIISINKTESNDIVAFDTSWKDLMPNSGTYISIGNKKYLLFNNSRHNNYHNAKDGFPFPVKLAIDCNVKEHLSDVKTIHQLVNQVYQFSRMYWKSLSQQNLPVTIKYPEMVAQIAPHFDGESIPKFGKDNLWFL